MKEINIEVSTKDCKRPGFIQGRNGTADLTAVHIWGDDMIFIDGIGKRGRTINGGLQIPRSVFEEIVEKAKRVL